MYLTGAQQLFFLLILIVIFFLCRELMCWYWKINELVRLQKESNEIKEDQLEVMKQNLESSNKLLEIMKNVRGAKANHNQ